MRSTFYEIIGVPTHATQGEIAAAVRERLATTWGDEREVIINAANTLLDRESRESYDRLNGIVKARGREQIASDSAAEVAHYAETERLRRAESAFAELAWTLNFLAVGVGIGLWVVLMFQGVPPLALELNRLLISSRDFTTLMAGIILTIPVLILGYFAMNIFSETLHITLRYLIVCGLLGGVIWGVGNSILASDAAWGVQLVGIVGILLGTIMFARYMGIRQLRNIGDIRPARSNRRDQP